MHIGIDARSIFTNGGGDRTYFRNVIAAMARLSPEDRWTLYADHADPDRETLRAPNVTIASPLPAPVGALWNVTALLPRLRRDHVSLLHAQYMLPPFGNAPCPMVVTIHDVTFRLFPEWFPKRANRVQNLLIPQAARRATRILTGSQSAANDIARTMQIDPHKICVTPYGVEARFRPASAQDIMTIRTRYELPERYLIGVGLLRTRKNIATVLRTIQHLRAQGQWPSDTVLALTGDWAGAPPEAQALVNADADLKALCPLLGYVPDDDLPALYSGATASVYPSLYEGFGLPALEAMACGCPVISTDTSSLPEVVGDAGILLPPDDVAGWAAAIAEMFADTAQRDDLSQRGIARAAQFTWERTARETLTVYREIVGSP